MKIFQVLWTKTADTDLESVINYIAEKNPLTALRLLKTIRAKASRLKTYPQRGRYPAEINHLSGLPFRELVISPWRLIYQIKGTKVEVLAFLDGRRDLESLIHERIIHSMLKK